MGGEVPAEAGDVLLLDTGAMITVKIFSNQRRIQKHRGLMALKAGIMEEFQET